MQKSLKHIADYRIKKIIEEGNYAIVYNAVDRDNKEVVLKVAKENTPEINSLIVREFKILSQFNHPNIAHVFDYNITEHGEAFFCLEYIKGKPINVCFDDFTQDFIRAILQLLNGIGAFHKKGFIHSDLKPEHLLYDKEKSRAVIIDFGFAGVSSRRIKEYGTLGYVAPEILKGIGNDQRSDLYSLGVIIYEILAGARPKMPYQTIKKIPETINNLLKNLLSEEPSMRPAVPELTDGFHQYLKEKILIPEYEVRLPITGFVRDDEIMRHLTHLSGNTVVLVGEIGSGKTRLLRELRYDYLFRDYIVFLYTGAQQESFHESLCKLVGCGEEVFSDKEDRFQVYAEIFVRLSEYARNKKIILLVDDIDGLNDYELGLIRYIGHNLLNTQMAMICTAKPDARISDLRFFELFLEPFNIEKVRELLEKTFFALKAKADNDTTFFARWLYHHTGGNPLFIVEILNELYQRKILYYTFNHWQIEIDLLKTIQIPERIEQIISHRLKALNQSECKILKAIVLAKIALDINVLQELAGLSVSIEIEVLKSLGLIKEEHHGGKRHFALANRFVQMLVEKDINDREAFQIMAKIARIYESMKPVEPDIGPVLGNLYERMGNTERAFEYYLMSGKHFEKINDHDQAIFYYKKLLEYCKDVEPDKYDHFVLKLSELHLLSGNDTVAIEYYKSLIDAADNNTKIKALYGLGKAHSNTGEHDKAIQYYQEILRLLEKKQVKEYVETANRLAYSLCFLQDYEGAEKYLNESLTIASKTGEHELVAETMYYQAILAWFKNQIEQGIGICEELLDFCLRHRLHKQHAYTANLLGSFHIHTGNNEKGLECIDTAIRDFERMNIPFILSSALNNKALLLSKIGDDDKARVVYEKSLAISLSIGSKTNQHIALTGLASIYADTGRFDKAIEYYQNSLNLDPENVLAIYGLACVYYKKGEIEKAKDILDKGIKQKDDILCQIALGRIFLDTGNPEQAEKLIDTGLKNLEKHTNLDASYIIEAYMNACQYYYEKGDYKNTIYYACKIKNMPQKTYIESVLCDIFAKMADFRSGNTESLDIDNLLQVLKTKGHIYDFACVNRLYIESIIDRETEPEKLKDISDELENIEQIFSSIGAKLELNRVKDIKLSKLYPVFHNSFMHGSVSVQYLDTFSKLSDIISKNLGDNDFVKHILDLVINATGAERGAIFIKSDEKMNFVAGRNMDKKTIKDADELSKTAIDEIDKNRIVFVPNALDDPRFNIKKSVLLNQIRSILCIPLAIGTNVIGAIYLDSRMIGSIFREIDKNFLEATAKILAAVIDRSEVYKKLYDELITLRTGAVMEIGKGYLMGKSKVIKNIHKLIEDVAPSEAPVLICGETGVGKGMIARLIHMKSKRREKKFVSINCGTIPETLLESELFGYKKGAFTGAVTDKKGLLEEGEAGTVFLDEITNTSPAFQAKLLEAIEDKVIRRLGETQTRTIDVRFLFATNKDLEIEVEEGRFRRDLYYRINVFMVKVPSLRERIEDITPLAHFFLELKAKEMNKRITGFSPEAMRLLREYPWTGNVRELQNVIERAVVLTKSEIIMPDVIGFTKEREMLPIKDLTREAVITCLNLTGWSIKETAKMLGVSRRTIERYIKKYNITK